MRRESDGKQDQYELKVQSEGWESTLYWFIIIGERLMAVGIRER